MSIDYRHDRLFENAFEYAAIGMALVSLEGQWLRVNRSICDIVVYKEAELLQISSRISPIRAILMQTLSSPQTQTW